MEKVQKKSGFKDLQDYFYSNYVNDLEDLTREKKIDEDKFREICDYLHSAKYTKIKLEFEVSDYDYAYCDAFSNTRFYSSSFGVDTLWSLQAYDFLL